MVDFQWIVNGKDNYYLYHLHIELGDMQFHVYWFTFKFFILLFSNSRNTLKQHTQKYLIDFWLTGSLWWNLVENLSQSWVEPFFQSGAD